MTFDHLFISRKLEELKGYFVELSEDVFRFSMEEILKSRGLLHIAERLFQLMVDTMVDINQHVIREQNLELSEDFQGTFRTLGDHGILPKDLAERIAPVVGMRNLIVHRYEKLDRDPFINELIKEHHDFEDYLKHIQMYLDRIGTS